MWLSGDCFSFRWIALPADTISSSRNHLFLSILMSSGKQKNGADARAKKAALLFVACERNPDPTGRLSIPNVLRVKGYSEDGALAMAEDQLATIRPELGGARLVILALRGSRSTSSTTTRRRSRGRRNRHRRWAIRRAERSRGARAGGTRRTSPGTSPTPRGGMGTSTGRKRNTTTGGAGTTGKRRSGGASTARARGASASASRARGRGTAGAGAWSGDWDWGRGRG